MNSFDNPKGPMGTTVHDRQAWQDIERMKASEKFINMLFNPQAIGHEQARREWDDAHRLCYTNPHCTEE